MSRRARKIRRIGLGISLGFLATATVAYHWLLHPGTVEPLLRDSVSEFTEASLDLEVVYASPIFGLHLRKVQLHDERFDLPILRADEIRLRWFLPGFFAGHAGLREATIENGTFSMLATEDGGWNTDALTGPAPAEPQVETVAGPDSLPLYLPFKFFAYLNLRNCRVEVMSPDLELELDRLNLRAGFVTNSITRLPLGPELLERFDALALQLGGDEAPRIEYRTPSGGMSGVVPLAWHLHRDTDLSQADLSSRLRLDTSGLRLEAPGKASLPLGIRLDYDIDYVAEQDRLMLSRLELAFRDDPWLSLTGDMFGVVSRSRHLDLTLRPSRFDLGALYGVLQRFGDLGVPELAGKVELAGMRAEGPLEKLATRGKLAATGVAIDREWRFPEVRADWVGSFDFYQIFSFLAPPDGYDPDKRLAFGVIHRLRAPDLFANFNGGKINADVSIIPETGIKARAQVQGFPLEFFTGPYLSGRLGAELDFVSSEDFGVIKLDGVTRLDGMRYVIDRSRSAVQNARTNLDGTIRVTDEAVLLDFKDIDLGVRDAAGDQFLRLFGNLGMRFDEGSVYNIDARKLTVDYELMRPTMPGYLQYELAPFRRYLSKGLELETRLDLGFYETSSVTGDALLKIPFLNVNDLKARLDLVFGDTFASFRRLELSGLRDAVRATVQGELRADAKGLWRPNLKANLDLNRAKNTRVHPNITLRGLVKMTVDARPSVTRGDLRIENFDLRYSGDSPRKSDVTKHPLVFDVRRVQLKLPFSHDPFLKNPRRLSERAGDLFLRNYGFHATPNLQVRHVSASHNPRGEYKKDRYYYLGGPARPGLRARLVYEKNVLYLPWLEALVLHGRSGKKGGAGAINGRNMYFNLADLDLKRMEYGADLQIQDLDLEPYLPFSRGNYDGRISADLRLRGRDLDDPLRTMDARLSVFRLSPEFSGFATRLVMPERLMAGIVNNTVSIPSIRVELKEGLVYSSVTMARGGLGGLLVKPARQELKQERVPLAQFTARSREVVNEFGQRGPEVQTAAAPAASNEGSEEVQTP